MEVEREREVKLAADDHVRIGDLAGVLPGASVEVLAPAVLTAKYFDTVDLRLARWGCTVRHRDDSGWVVKLPQPASGAMLVRDEIKVPADGRTPPTAATRLVASLARGAALSRVATLTTTRAATRFYAPDGTRLAEIVDDRVEIEGADGSHDRFREIEVEVGAATSSADVDRLLQRLHESGCLASPGLPKLVRGLGARAAAEPDVVVPQVSRWPTGREILRASIARNVAQLLLQLPAARVGEDVEAVHQARVAIRRMRCDLRSFRNLFDAAVVADLEGELRWLGRLLGSVRDDDVLIATLVALDVEPALLSIFEGRRATDRAALLRALDNKRTLRLLNTLVAFAANPHLAPQADDPAEELLRPIVRKAWSKLRDAADALPPAPSDEAVHRVRILTKRLRFALEAVAPAYDNKPSALIKALRRLQDSLGELCDAAAVTERLRDTEAMTAAQSFAVGQLSGRILANAEAQGDAWRQSWKSARNKKLRRWL